MFLAADTIPLPPPLACCFYFAFISFFSQAEEKLGKTCLFWEKKKENYAGIIEKCDAGFNKELLKDSLRNP